MSKQNLNEGEHFRPSFPRSPRKSKMVAAVSQFYGRPEAEVGGLYDTYRKLHKQKKYRKRFGELKTLCFDEAFVIFVGLAIVRPSKVVEIGTQYGKSTRRILDMKEPLGLQFETVCYDIVDLVEQFEPGEADLRLEDVTGRFKETVLDGESPGLIYLDAHPWDLLEDVIGTFIEESPETTMAIHDCGRGLCNPRMTITKQDPEITSHTGVWERHVLAKQFGVADPLSERLDEMESDTHRLRIFGTPHGLAAIAPLSLVG